MFWSINSLSGLLGDAKSSSCEEQQTLTNMKTSSRSTLKPSSQRFIYSDPAVELGTRLSEWNIVKAPLRKVLSVRPSRSRQRLGLWDVWKWMKKKKKRFMAEMRWNTGWGLEREREKKKLRQKLLLTAWWKWRHLCGFRGIYRHGSSAEPECGAAKFEWRKSRIRATSHTPDPLLIFYPWLPPPSPAHNVAHIFVQPQV